MSWERGGGPPPPGTYAAIAERMLAEAAVRGSRTPPATSLAVAQAYATLELAAATERANRRTFGHARVGDR